MRRLLSICACAVVASAFALQPAAGAEVNPLSGLGSILPAPGPHVEVRATELGHVSNPYFDGGSIGQAFTLSCPSPVEQIAERLRITWNDATATKSFVLTEITAATCEENGSQKYSATGIGLCDGAPAVVELTLTRAGSDRSGSVRITGATCTLAADGANALSGSFSGCLVFGSSNACDPSGQGGLDGWMTGDGTFGDPAAAHSGRLDCTKRSVGANNLTVTWADGSFTLTSLGSAACSDRLGTAGEFDTITGKGTGTCNGTVVSASWMLEDAGEAGRADTATIEISEGGTCPGLFTSGSLATGNNQAHQRK